MTSQQRGDGWLALWRELRAEGWSPVEIDRLIDRALVEVYAGRVDRVAEAIKSARDADLICT